eukprot:7950827-Pyramimonas_sp.AAC.1
MEAWLAWLGDISSVRSIVARRSTDLAQDIPVEWSTSQLIIVGRCMLVGRRNRQIGKVRRSGSEGQGQGGLRSCKIWEYCSLNPESE